MIAALISAAVLAVGATAQAAPGFTTVTSLNPGTNYNEIDGVAAISSGNAWAVGFQRSSGLLFSASVPTANDTRLHSAAALSSTSIWAVGVNTTIPSNSRVHVNFALRREALLIRVEVRELRLRPVAAGRCS